MTPVVSINDALTQRHVKKMEEWDNILFLQPGNLLVFNSLDQLPPTYFLIMNLKLTVLRICSRCYLLFITGVDCIHVNVTYHSGFDFLGLPSSVTIFYVLTHFCYLECQVGVIRVTSAYFQCVIIIRRLTCTSLNFLSGCSINTRSHVGLSR